MKVSILQNGVVIGYSILDATDPPMGVASGKFEPTSDYDPQRHAFLVDEVYLERTVTPPLTAHLEDFGAIECAGVGIEDLRSMMEGIEVTVLGIPYPDYETFFSSYDAYKAYWK
ncbi:hypothetical protein UAJ10_00070 [Nitrospirillum sp. BR 11164]|uniref:hypothetical protein n=1 Tax=Nitrospirillum sp. BR 11164 TaxID=3104324 RepID=UPI002AFF2C15|nr:hypothetical protein [Nitrospirillum sp. BR 11164]MEA1647409.1 hypothetical protein [Nitrospirillum sp. BR 11164]